MATKGKPKTLTPRLRFPEFRGAPSWPIEPLGRLFSERQETGFSDLPLLSVTDRDGVIPQEETNRKNNSNSDKTKYLRVVPGDIAYNTMRMWEGRSARVGLDGLVSPAYTVCQPEVDTSSLFFAYYFKTQPLIAQFRRYSQGLVKDTLNLKYEAFSCIPVGFPSPAEQRKIAACLMSLDEWIAAEGRKLEELREHKKGLMQQLFPREGENRPRLRFPEFRDAPEWTVHPLDEFVVRSFYGTSSSTSEKGQYPVLRMGNMVDGGLDVSSLVYIDLDKKELESIRLTDGDILLNRTNSLDLVGKISIFRLPGNYITASYIVTYRIDAHRLDPPFCNLMLNTQQYQQRIKAFARPSVSQANINPTTFRKELTVAVPRLAEQRRIATCFSSLDALIVAQSRKLDGLRLQKRGLMQRLFPSPEGM